jgi:hypothetical protein
MNRTQHRFLSIVAAGAAAFTVGASPALAGSDGCGDDGDCRAENAPAQVVPAPPTPVTPGASVPAPSVDSGGTNTKPERASKSPRRSSKQVRGVNRTIANRTVGNRTVGNRTVAQRTTPRGGVQAGAGGTAPQGPDGALFGIAGAGLVLVATGGRLVAARRNARS